MTDHSYGEVNFSRYILAGIILLPLALLDLRKRQVPSWLAVRTFPPLQHGSCRWA